MLTELEGQLGGIIIFQLALLVGISFVSIHYRKKYEKLKKKINDFKVKFGVEDE